MIGFESFDELLDAFVPMLESEEGIDLSAAKQFVAAMREPTV